MQIEWARHISAHGRVLIFAPLAVTHQTIREGKRWGVDIVYAKTQDEVGDASIAITNYERLSRFDPSSFVGVVIDESGILKAYTGKTKRALVRSCASVPFRLACTATPAPNDHLELGNHSEFLGIMTSHQMIARWFINDHLGVSFDLRWYNLSIVEPSATSPGAPRASLLTAAVGISVK